MMRHATLAVTLAFVILGTTLIAQADKTVIEGPGFKMEQKDGWFGTSEHTYTDALGNTYVKKKGLFGRTAKKSRIFGSEVEQKGDNLNVTAPDGTPLITRKKKLFGGEETHINGNGMWNAISGFLKPSSGTVVPAGAGTSGSP